MRNHKWMKWVLILALLMPLTFIACTGDDTTVDEVEVEDIAEDDIDDETGEVIDEGEDEIVEDEDAELVDEDLLVDEEDEEMVEEEDEVDVVEEEEDVEVVEEEEVTVEETFGALEPFPTLNGIATCEVAEDGPLAGVDPQGVEFVWWHQHSGAREEGLLEMVDRFNEQNACNITVVAQNQGGYDDIRDKVNASVQAGELPAALIVGYQNDQAFYELNDALTDLSVYMDSPVWGLSEADEDNFFNAFLVQGVHPAFDNQRLGFPPNRSMEVMYYNQTWLEELGFDGPPTTPEEFREQACAAAESGSGGYILRDDASAVAAWTFAFGGNVLAEDGTRYDYANDATVEALAFLKDLYDDGCAYFFTEGYPNPEFAARRALFAQGSSSGLPFYMADIQTVAEEEGREPDEWGVTAIPHTTPEPVQNIYGADIMITETTPEQELAAWIFVKWFTTPEIQAEWNTVSNYFPTRRATTEFLGDYVSENPQWGAALSLLEFGTFEPQLISYQSVRDQTSETFNIIMNLPEGATEDDIREILVELTDFANEQQEELMEEVE